MASIGDLRGMHSRKEIGNELKFWVHYPSKINSKGKWIADFKSHYLLT